MPEHDNGRASGGREWSCAAAPASATAGGLRVGERQRLATAAGRASDVRARQQGREAQAIQPGRAADVVSAVSARGVGGGSGASGAREGGAVLTAGL